MAALDAAGNASAQSTSVNAQPRPHRSRTSYSYDPNGNRLTAVDPAGTITTVYDRLNRPTSVTLSADGGAMTTYTYSLASPAWTDPSGGASTWSTTYRADGQPLLLAAPNGNTTAFGCDDAGQPQTKTTTAAGPVTRAATRSRATGPARSSVRHRPSPAIRRTIRQITRTSARLTGFARSTTAAYGWDKVPNRTSIQAGAGTPVTTTYSDANRPLADSGGAAGSYTSDTDGRQTSPPEPAPRMGCPRMPRPGPPGDRYHDHRDIHVRRARPAPDGRRGRSPDPYRYVGQTTAVAQTVNHVTGLPIRSIGTEWGGERLVDWTTGGANQRFYGTNGHHDVTWTADSTGAVSATLR